MRKKKKKHKERPSQLFPTDGGPPRSCSLPSRPWEPAPTSAPAHPDRVTRPLSLLFQGKSLRWCHVSSATPGSCPYPVTSARQEELGQKTPLCPPRRSPRDRVRLCCYSHVTGEEGDTRTCVHGIMTPGPVLSTKDVRPSSRAPRACQKQIPRVAWAGLVQEPE